MWNDVQAVFVLKPDEIAALRKSLIVAGKMVDNAELSDDLDIAINLRDALDEALTYHVTEE